MCSRLIFPRAPQTSGARQGCEAGCRASRPWSPLPRRSPPSSGGWLRLNPQGFVDGWFLATPTPNPGRLSEAMALLGSLPRPWLALGKSRTAIWPGDARPSCWAGARGLSSRELAGGKVICITPASARKGRVLPRRAQARWALPAVQPALSALDAPSDPQFIPPRYHTPHTNTRFWP